MTRNDRAGDTVKSKKTEGFPVWRLLVSGLLGGLLVAGANLIVLSRQLSSAKKHLEINLSRDLVREFFRGNPEYKEFRTAIDNCEPLYKRWGGKFDHDQVNLYLDFFEDLGFYLRTGVLRLETIAHSFGSFTIEAFEYNEVQRYIAEMRKGMKQEEIFKDFEYLARRLESDPKRHEEVELARRSCQQGNRVKSKRSP